MTSTYNHGQRVLKAFQHQEPDRVPLDMMGNATMLLDQTYYRLRDYLGFSPIPPIRFGTTANYYDERILEYFDIDFRRLFLPRNAKCTATLHRNGSFTDPWGVRFQPQGLQVNVVHSPLRNMTTVEEIDSHPWPTAQQMFCADGLAEAARRTFIETDYGLVARNPITAGFLDRASELVEMSEFLMMMLTADQIRRDRTAYPAHLVERQGRCLAAAVRSVLADDN